MAYHPRRAWGIALGCLTAVLFAVTAHAALELTSDGRSLFFGVMQLGQSKELSQSGSFHNAITCTSSSGGSWYLKVQVLQPLSSGQDSIPLEHFQWQVANTTGRGTLSNPYRFNSFHNVPELVYVSGPDEASGAPVTFQFKYMLRVPQAQVSGIYQTTIRFTLTEIL